MFPQIFHNSETVNILLCKSIIIRKYISYSIQEMSYVLRKYTLNIL